MLVCRKLVLGLAVAATALSPAVAFSDPMFVFRYKSGLISHVQTDGCEGTDGPCDVEDDENEDAKAIDDVEFIPVDEFVQQDPQAPTELRLTVTDGERKPNSEEIVYQCFEASGGHGNYNFAIMQPLTGDMSWVSDFDIVAQSHLGSPMSAHFDVPMMRTFPVFDYENRSFDVTATGEVCVRFLVDTNVWEPEPVTVSFSVADYPTEMISSGAVSETSYFDAPSVRMLTFSMNPANTQGWSLPPQSLMLVMGPSSPIMNLGENPFPFHASGGSGDYTWSVTGDGVTYDPEAHTLTFAGNMGRTWKVTVVATDTEGLSARKQYSFILDPETAALCEYTNLGTGETWVEECHPI
jgi:hypothetical protein